MLCERLVAFVDNLTRFGIGDSFAVPVPYSIDKAVEFHPAACLAIEIIADDLFEKRSLFILMARLRRKFAVEFQTSVNTHVETT